MENCFRKAAGAHRFVGVIIALMMMMMTLNSALNICNTFAKFIMIAIIANLFVAMAIIYGSEVLRRHRCFVCIVVDHKDICLYSD